MFRDFLTRQGRHWMEVGRRDSVRTGRPRLPRMPGLGRGQEYIDYERKPEDRQGDGATFPPSTRRGVSDYSSLSNRRRLGWSQRGPPTPYETLRVPGRLFVTTTPSSHHNRQTDVPRHRQNPVFRFRVKETCDSCQKPWSFADTSHISIFL